MKNFKALSIAATIVAALITSCFMAGCHKEAFAEKSEAEQIVNSEEYQAMANEISSMGSSITSKFLQLAKSDKENCKKILNKILSDDVENEDDMNILLAELSSLLNIDFRNQIENIQEHTLRVPISESVSKRDIIIASKRAGILNKTNFPRLKNGNNENDDALTNCMDSCAITSIAAMLFCIGPQAGPCVASVMAVYALCCILC
jgi:hypothetical protein